MRYMIASGWWSSSRELDSRARLFGDDMQRSVDFHQLWLSAINKFASPHEILVIDSASPNKPSIDSSEKWFEMSRNFGHSTNHEGKYSGVTRSFILSMTYCCLNDYDYWVYVEQDCLVYGSGIVERVIESMNSPIVFGNGAGTPQPIQQSFMVLATSRIPSFINNLIKIRATDNEISPEEKFALAASPIFGLIPSWIAALLGQRVRKDHFIGRLIRRLCRLAPGYECLPFGSGRSRPVPIGDPFFYFQHGSSEELAAYVERFSQVDRS